MHLEKLLKELKNCWEDSEHESLKFIVARELRNASNGNGAADNDIWSCFGPIEHEFQVELPEAPRKLTGREVIAALKEGRTGNESIKEGHVQQLWVLEIGPSRPDEPGDDDDDGPTDVDIWSLSEPLQRMLIPETTGSRGQDQGGLPHLRVHCGGPSLPRSEGRAS